MLTNVRRASGFSLVEVMVVVAIIGLLASIALPSYNEHVRKTRRAAAGACVMAMAQQLERFYTVNMSYSGATINTTVCQDNALEHYNVTASISGPMAYTVSAAPFQSDACGTMGVDQAGVKTASGSNCW